MNKKQTNNKKMGPQASTLSIIRRLSGYLSQYKGSVILIALGFIISTLLGLTPAWLVKISLDRFLTPEKVNYLWLVAAGMIGAVSVQGIIDFFIRYLAESRGQKVVYTIRQQLYRHFMRLSFSYFDQSATGDVMSRITADAETLQTFFGFASIHIIGNSLFIIGILVVMFFWSTPLAILYILMLPFMIFGITRYAFKVRPAFGKSRGILAKLTAVIQEQLQGIQVIKIFGREKQTVSSFKKANERFFQINLEAGKITSFWMPFVFVLMGLATGVIIWYGGMQVIKGNVSLGTLVGFTTYMGMMMRPIRQTGMLISRVMVSAASAERIFQVLDTDPEVKDSPGAQDVSEVNGKVCFENVSFSYDKQTPVLKGISFCANPGETIAIVGPTGAGKSTLVHLLPRFYDADSGQITIDDQSTKDMTLESLRRNIGIVLQHAFLFNVTIKENIRFGKPDASMNEIITAAKSAGIHDFIMTLPKKYDTKVGERGVKLSGGQKQRLSIARTILLNPPLLILDEPTSSVDAQTDEKILKAIDQLTQGRTVFMIAHRLWTLKNADKILVIDKGRVAQFGTPEELMAQPGLYRQIYTLQIDGESFGIVKEKPDDSGEVKNDVHE